MQSMTFPSLQYLGRFSPFDSPPPPPFEKWAEHRENKTRFVGVHHLNSLISLAYIFFFFFIKTYCNPFFFSFSLVCSSFPKEKAGER